MIGRRRRAILRPFRTFCTTSFSLTRRQIAFPGAPHHLRPSLLPIRSQSPDDMDEKSNSRVRTAIEVARILKRMRQLEADVEESDGVDGNGAIPAKLVISLLVQGKRSDECRDLHESPVTTANIASTRPWTSFTPSNAHHPTTGRQLTRRDVGLDVSARLSTNSFCAITLTRQRRSVWTVYWPRPVRSATHERMV